MKHGGDLTDAIAQHGGQRAAWLDLSTGINPWSYPIHALPGEIWQHLPSRAEEMALRDAARAAYGVADDVGIVAASGTQALIQWLPRLATGGSVAILGPTYTEHQSAWRDAGRDVVMLDSLDTIPADVRHLVIVNPNNPDGRVVDPATLAQLATTLRERGGWLIIDEAFADVCPEVSAAALCRDHPIVILRSFGKFYGLAGLRLGFAIARPDIARLIETAMGPWPCSGPALVIGTQALKDNAWRDDMRRQLMQQADRLDMVLQDNGFALVGGTSLYRLARHRDAVMSHARLAQQQIWCRRFDWTDDLLRFGLPPDQAALDRLSSALTIATG